MEILAFLLIVGCILIGFRLLGLVFKIGFFLLSIPLVILIAVLLTAVLFLILPIALFTGILSLFIAPLGFMLPLLPFLLIGAGIYLLARR